MMLYPILEAFQGDQTAKMSIMEIEDSRRQVQIVDNCVKIEGKMAIIRCFYTIESTTLNASATKFKVTSKFSYFEALHS